MLNENTTFCTEKKTCKWFWYFFDKLGESSERENPIFKIINFVSSDTVFNVG